MKQKQILQMAILVVFLLALLLAGWFFFSTQKQAANTVVKQGYDYVMKSDPLKPNKRAPTDYYMLALSWSPAFCESQYRRYGKNLPANTQYQCGSTQKFGWVVHGLWPQNANARSITEHPRYCQGDLPEVPRDVIEKYLPDSPSPYLLQGEWEKHGACVFKTADEYFAKIHQLFSEVKMPTYELESRKELFSWVRKNNPQLDGLYLGANGNELYICYDLNWHAMDCPRAVNYQTH
ncbi:MAG: ribonuclease T [Pasteurellaceae bacterium]|nr:ribonuclease T [Pasteurellaceae bacterium]